MTDRSKPGRPKRRRSRPSARGEQSRQAILDVAARYFGEFGYRGASTAAIANEVHISDPGLLHHFGSKDGLLMALLNRDVDVLAAVRAFNRLLMAALDRSKVRKRAAGRGTR